MEDLRVRILQATLSRATINFKYLLGFYPAVSGAQLKIHYNNIIYFFRIVAILNIDWGFWQDLLRILLLTVSIKNYVIVFFLIESSTQNQKQSTGVTKKKPPKTPQFD